MISRHNDVRWTLTTSVVFSLLLATHVDVLTERHVRIFGLEATPRKTNVPSQRF